MLPLIQAAALLMRILYSTIMRLQHNLGRGAHALTCAAAEGGGLALNLSTPQKSSVKVEPAPHSTTGEPCHAVALHLSAPEEGVIKLLHLIAGQMCKDASALRQCASQKSSVGL